ncbi:MAG: DNA polymerase III subunit delta [Deltaproteobacteria bacterium]|nr:DNA polymerase III subunit delta [Deltaproteobacteria bacterium]
MAGELLPDDLLKSLDKGQLAPFYLFYGPDEFRLEKLLDRIREEYIPDSARDLNLEICYGGETSPAEIVNRAQTLPFMARSRLIIVRRTEEFKADKLEIFLPYLEDPSQSTCLIFVSSRTDFKRKFYKKIRASGLAVSFMELKERQVGPWIRRTAKEMSLKVDGQACDYLQQIAGNRLRGLYSELVKLKVRYGDGDVGIEQVRELAIHSRIYSIFELMDAISEKDRSRSLSVLNRFLEEEDKVGGPLRFIGMLNRQIRLLWQTKSIVDRGGQKRDVTQGLGIAPFAAGNFVKQSKRWSGDELERGLSILYRADGLLKSGSRPKPVLEDLVLTLCG